MILESPLIQNLLTEKAHQYIVTFLEARFGNVPRDLVEEIESVVDEKQLKGLVRLAGSCSDLDAFRRAMAGI